ncbi:Cytochrome P450 [Macrophomina phaseolina MS6]|uniref:Cytochrome P450 n=1 Tax=Macrophomina phaseolina (strain MS6) TaxID=1126212 RepID=K2SQ06_MACPH|nr:Cytochrome P450 [Macrophomina phaseolina MS6]
MEQGSVLPRSFVSASGLVFLLKASLLLSLLYFIGSVVYNVYFHPLSKYPSPKCAAASNAPYRFIGARGPNRLSYISGRDFKEIYGHRTGGKKLVMKDQDVYQPAAFSDKVLKAQESLIRTYADKLVDNMRAKAGDWCNAVKLYNCATFDILADLTFGESLGLLDNGQYWPWVETIF